jgi:hypothetical protein
MSKEDQMEEKQPDRSVRLSEEQAAEIRRRIDNPNPKTMMLAEFKGRLKVRYGV